jgi:exonuclease VII small subunit
MKLIATLDLSDAVTLEQLDDYFELEGDDKFEDMDAALDYIVYELGEGRITLDDMTDLFDAVVEYTYE